MNDSPVVPISSSLTVLKSKVLIVCPWYKSVSPITAFCVNQLADKRRTASLLHFGDAFISHTRNSCADSFLGTSLEWSLWIDDDMVCGFGNAAWLNLHMGYTIPEPFASVNVLDRLLSHGKTLVGGLYFGRHPGTPAVYGEGFLNGADIINARKAPMDLCKGTKWVGTGCLLVHRTVFEDIEKKFPLLRRGPGGKGGQWFSTSEHGTMDGLRRIKEMFEAGPITPEKGLKAYEMVTALELEAKANSSLAMGEDVQFCTRAKQAGHQPYVDFGCLCGHIGHHIYGPRG